MLRVGQYLFKRAETDEELEQVHRLNYRTFVGEIPQHPDPGEDQLIDKFHDKNAYFIVLCEGRVIGMVSGHDQPPFSIAQRLKDPQILQRPGTRPLEVRLLAIEPDKRNSTVFFGLVWSLYDFALSRGYSHLFISGLKERTFLYRRLGFEPLGPAVASGKAYFVPMVLTVGRLPSRAERVKKLWELHVERVTINGALLGKIGEWEKESRPAEGAPRPLPPRAARAEVCLLPGPVTTAPAVREAFHRPPIYHRGPEFIALFQKVRKTLAQLVGGRDVALMNGSGTLANECVAAVLGASSGEGQRGVLLVNGEFGQRLAKQATRFGLHPRTLSWPWGQSWDLDEIDAALAKEPPGSWVWGVHLESSTGVLNDLPGLVQLARARGLRVCLDCISSLGAVPIDLQGVYLATGATGKSLGSYAGVAIVFAEAADVSRLDMTRVASYLDIAAALLSQGPRYTFPSPILQAVEAALAEYATPPRARLRYERYAALGSYVRQQLRQLGLEPLAGEGWACPVVTTFSPPAEQTSEEFVARCRAWGFTIGGQSGYLAERRLVQIATMGAVSREECVPLFEHLSHWLARQPSVVAH
ncbi:MAG TPA: aminotransferase class V-fold PLP-dependent enzyme [Gemmataceae bacterium]|jgi:aspartate aminotransferase-like enzyme|nr:aminotransferase class V-fold PLP-dependent enzyme [Gemmataceae bacterium]